MCDQMFPNSSEPEYEEYGKNCGEQRRHRRDKWKMNLMNLTVRIALLSMMRFCDYLRRGPPLDNPREDLILT